MHPMLNIAVRAARAAGNVIMRNFDRRDTLTIGSKGQHDYVSEVDKQAEQEIIRTLSKAYPDHSILAEESGSRNEGSEYRWVIDPLDGTTNYLHGFPQFSVSIALLHRGKPDQAVVYDPFSQELFTASRGSGAQLNDRRLRVSHNRSLDDALLGTGFPFREFAHLDAYMGMFRELMVSTAGIRRPGSAALDLAYVAAGRLDGFWEIGLNPWDMAAGALLIQEAGGMVSDLAGGPDFLDSGNVVAGNPKIHQALIKVIGGHLGADLRR